MDTFTYWEGLADEKRPIIMYGTGNGGDKILDACESYGISVKAVFASDGFVRNRIFRDMPVKSYSQIREEYGDDVVILPAFGTTLPEVMEFFKLLDSRHELIIPEVPLYGGGIFDAEYYSIRREEILKVRGFLSDEASRELFDDVINFRLTGKLKYLSRCESVRDSYRNLPHIENIRTAVDGGAFKGDSAEDMIKAFHNLEKLVALEPDPKTFVKLSDFAKTTDGVVIPMNFALGEREELSVSVTSGSRGSGVLGKNRRAKTTEISRTTIDKICENISPDFIKLDVEGEEMEAISGGVCTLRKSRPTVAVSLYHRTEDIISIPTRLKELFGNVKMYLRRPECIPMWDLNLYVVPN